MTTYTFRSDVEYTLIDNHHFWVVTLTVFLNGHFDFKHQLGTYCTLMAAQKALADCKKYYLSKN